MGKMHKFFMILVCLGALLLIAARPLQEPDFTDLTAVLTWLAGLGAPYVVGWIISLLAENWPAWHNLPRFVKFISPLIASALIAVGATLLLRQTGFIELIAPWFTIVATAILAYLGTQQAYMTAKRAGYGSSARQG